MYIVLAHIKGKGWGIVAFEPHEDCVVRMISMIDSQFGDGTAWAGKLPDKGDDNDQDEHAENAEHAGTAIDVLDMLKQLENGQVDLNAALAELNNNENENS